MLNSKTNSNPEEELSYYKAILENVTDMVVILELDGKIRYISPSCKTILGYEQDEMVGKNTFSYLHPDDYKSVFGIFIKTMAQKDAQAGSEFRLKCKDGSWKHIESIGKNLLFDPKIHGAVLISRDITERKKIEAQILLQHEALEAASNGIVITDARGTIVWVNNAFTKMTGYSAELAIGKKPNILKSGEQSPEVYAELWKTILSGKTWAGELINRRKDGTLYFEKMSVTPVVDSKGITTHFVAIKEDISTDKKLEAQFRQAQKMEAVGRLAGGVAHDFNNLLTVILGRCDLLIVDAQKGRTLNVEGVKEIEESGRRAANLTRQLLAFSRKQVFQTKVMNINDIVRSCDKLIRRLVGEDIEIVTLLADDLRFVKVDAGQIEQVLMNLAVNARDAMPNGGKLVIETSEVKIDQETASAFLGFTAGEYVRIKVQDNGTGIAPEAKAHLFEPFFTTKEKGKGTGLGLATIYGVVKQSGGYIYADSEPGKGAVFSVYLPITSEKMSAGHEALHMDLPVGNETILLAEDEDLVRGLTAQMLMRQGFNVLEVRNGLEALRKAEGDKNGPIHLLLTDIIMPYMGGSELVEKFSKLYPGTKILFTSGYSDQTSVKKWLDKGHRFIQKPYMIPELLRAVRETLDTP